MKIYIATSNTDISFLPADHSECTIPDSFSDYNYIAIPSDSEYTCYSVYVSNGKTIASKLPTFNSVTDCQLQVFILCSTVIHEIASPDRVCEKYSITPQKLTEALERAINRIMLSDYERELVTALYLHNVPKRELITKYNLSSFNINNMLSTQIKYFCRSEYEKRFLTDRIENDFKSGESFFIGLSAASQIMEIPESFAHEAIQTVFDHQHVVRRDKLKFVESVIFGETDFSGLTDSEKEDFNTLINKIINFYREKEKSVYNHLADAIIEKASFTYSDLNGICNAMNMNIHMLTFALFKKGFKSSGRLRRKSLKDYLPD